MHITYNHLKRILILDFFTLGFGFGCYDGNGYGNGDNFGNGRGFGNYYGDGFGDGENLTDDYYGSGNGNGEGFYNIKWEMTDGSLNFKEK